MSFYDKIKQEDWEDIKERIYEKTSLDVQLAISREDRGLEDFMALISPAAAPFLEEMAQESQRLTLQRFGKTMQMYVPLYLSNECANGCTYCGFSAKNSIPRKTLTKDEILAEAEAIKKLGFKHILLVTGENHKKSGFGYLKQAIEWLRPHFPLISIEVQPMSEEEYAELAPLGLNTVYVYQETYHEENYKDYHPKGKKSEYQFRLETPDRIGKAGIHKIGIGALLGLEDWRTDTFFSAMHLAYLEKKYWKTKYSLSFPRLRPHVGAFEPKSIIDDRELVQLICAYRLFNQELEISLSTRESSAFRNHAMKLGITSMSAGSKTEPGGYAVPNEELKQFEIADDRSPSAVAEMIKANGYEVVWKDWDASFDTKE